MAEPETGVAEIDEGVYPPQRHLYRHLDIEVDTTQDGVGVGIVPALPDLAGPDGSIRLAAIAATMDMTAGSLAVRLLHPDWTATSSLSIRTGIGVTSGSVVMTCRPLHTGKRSVFMDVGLADETGTTVGTATIGFARISRENAYGEAGAPEGSVTRYGLPTDEPRVPLEEYVGIRHVPGEDGTVETDLEPQIRNSTGVLQGGALATIIEAAALRAGSSHLGERVRVADFDVYYLAAGKTGPFRATASPVRVTDSHLVARIELKDEGAQGRLIAIATATLLKGG